MNDMPQSLNLLKIFALVSAIMNIIFALSWIVYTIIGGVISCGIGCLLGIFPVINIIACVMDFIAFNKLNGLSQGGTYGSVQFASIFDIITFLTGNVVSMIFGIMGLIYLNQDETKNYLIQKGIY